MGRAPPVALADPGGQLEGRHTPGFAALWSRGQQEPATTSQRCCWNSVRLTQALLNADQDLVLRSQTRNILAAWFGFSRQTLAFTRASGSFRATSGVWHLVYSSITTGSHQT
mmetsp:Transcript_37837/g.96775  ORF Transcript_37837/g.96775 Transcript_37837/m.96775 type:complete len:112 (+) Transcript_37837:1307-1642(+)